MMDYFDHVDTPEEEKESDVDSPGLESQNSPGLNSQKSPGLNSQKSPGLRS
jgi:hypothetical protein